MFEVYSGENNCTLKKMLDLDLSVLTVFTWCMNVSSQVILSTVVLKSSLKVTHLYF